VSLQQSRFVSRAPETDQHVTIQSTGCSAVGPTDQFVKGWTAWNYDVICDITMLRVVLDTDVMVAGLSSATGASRRLLLAVLDREVRMLLSTPLLIEYEAVLTRPAVLAMARVSAEEVVAVLDELLDLCAPVAFDYRWRPQARDPDDDLVPLHSGFDRLRPSEP